MATALLARFPLGVYQAHRANGRPDPFPDVARLYSALVSAAGTGSTAHSVGERLAPSEAAAGALRWFEANPPTHLSLPPRTRPGRRVTSYRQDGVIEKAKGVVKPRVVGKDVGDTVTVAGPLAWIWEIDIPSGVRDVLDALCADVAYLGESDSPVVLEFGSATATHRLDPGAGAFATLGEPVRTPITGRLDELERAHQSAYPAARPSASADRHSFSELPAPAAVAATACLVQRRYIPIDAEPVSAPWPHAWILPVHGRVRSSEIVPWCVTLHRALAARIAEPAPSVVTGRFVTGQARPANRVAIHYLDPSLRPLLAGGNLVAGQAALLVCFPADGDIEDRRAVEGALNGLTSLYRKDARMQLEPVVPVDAARFWLQCPVETIRLWTSVTPIVPETRPQPGTWSLADAAKLSVAFVARDQIPSVSGRGERRYRGLVAAIEDRRIGVGRIGRVTDPRVERYAHKLPESLIAQPYHALFHLGTLWHPQAFVAVGQSRHLGGGLLAPLDVPQAIAATLMENRR